MTSQTFDPTSQLFMVRIWFEPVGNGQMEVRYQVTHVLSRERRYFRDDATLLAFLLGSVEAMSGADVSRRDDM